jgi:hypothetical protein
MTVIDLPRSDRISSASVDVLEPAPRDAPDAALDVEQLGARIVGLAGRLAAGTCRWLLLVAEFDAREGYAKFCLASTARWLGHYCGLSHRTAIEHLRVARVLAAHPPLVEAMSAGRISFSHARAIARVAELSEPKLMAELVEIAEHGTVGQLEDMVRGLRTVHDNADPLPPEEAERVSHRWRDDSYLGLSAKLDPEHGALVTAAIETVARREGITQAAALTRMAEIALATLNSSDGPAPSLRGSEYSAIVVRLDAEKLPAEDAGETKAVETAADEPQPEVEARSAERGRPEPCARIANGPGLPDATVRRLLCSGRIRAIVTTDDADADAEGDGKRYRWRSGVLDVGANRRLVSDKQFRALIERDGAWCSVPGCGSAAGLEAHHVRHWIYGGKTVMANLVLLCRAHHHALHEHEFRIVALGRGQFRYLRADGRELPAALPRAQFIANEPAIDVAHNDVAPDAATTRWDGKRFDRHYAVATLAQRLVRDSHDPCAA